MKEGTFHVCKNCKTNHYSDDEKILMRDKWETWKLKYVCKECHCNIFYEKDLRSA